MPSKEAQEQSVVMTPDALKDIISSAVSTAVIESKKPYIDPALQAQREADRKQLQEQELLKAKQKQMRVAACTHRRYDGSPNLHAQCNSDQKVRIVCGTCNGQFHPGDPKYNELYSLLNFDNVAYARQV